MPGLELNEQAAPEITTETAPKPVLQRRSSATTTAVNPKLTVTAPKAAKRLESHFKGYAAGKKITIAVIGEDTLTLTGDDVTAAVKDYVLRYGDVTKAE